MLYLQDAAGRSLFSAKADSNKRGDGFNIGDRDNILDAVEAGPILVHVALAEGRQFPYEAIMRSVFKHLMDSATSEYLFTMEFFKVCLRVSHMISRPSPRVCVSGRKCCPTHVAETGTRYLFWGSCPLCRLRQNRFHGFYSPEKVVPELLVPLVSVSTSRSSRREHIFRIYTVE